MSFEFEIVDDRKAFDALGVKLRDFDGLAAFAGLFGEAEATKGFRHETGEGAEKRPWMGPAADESLGRAIALGKREIGKALDGEQSAEAALEPVGEVFETSARLYVEQGKVGGKKLSKAAKRRDPRKLIDSGDMLRALDTKVAKTIEGENS